MNDNLPPPPNPQADFGPIMAAKVRQDQIAAGAEVQAAREAAEIRQIKAAATIAQARAFIVVWTLLWFLVAIAAAGIRVAQYILWTWTVVPGA